MRPSTLRALLVGGALAFAGCTRFEFKDDFNRAELGDAWLNTGGPYRLVEGKLTVAGAHNKPLWLKRPLPENLELELTARSQSPSGDIKFELFGDGASYARTSSYTASGYVLVFGGWHNTRSLIARKDEHGAEVAERFDVPVEPGRSYRFKVTRKDGVLSWFIDGKPFLTYRDQSPLRGAAHRHFAFNNWESMLAFDDLSIRELRQP